MAQPLIRCENLVKIYKVPEAEVEVVALQGLELDVYPGEFLAIVGRSGSGKTTLMNILGALDVPSAGSAVAAGYRLARLSASEQDAYRRSVVGHVWQNAGRNLAPDLSVQQNIELPLLLDGAPARKRSARSRELLAMVGLETFGDRLPKLLSGGERQRVALAVALANGPRILLADEPTGELDTTSAQELADLLRRFTHEHGLTIVLVTHDPAIAAHADRTVAIRDGRTSTETTRRAHPAGAIASAGGGAVASLGAAPPVPAAAPQEAAVLDRAGVLQLPEAALLAIPFHGRADFIVRPDHVELWPRGTAPQAHDPLTSLAETVMLDSAGRLQLSEEALDRVPFGRRAHVRILADHVELWALSAMVALTREHTAEGSDEQQRTTGGLA